MLFSTPGLVLHTTPYGETSVIAKVFTRQMGVRSYIIKGVRGRSGRTKQNLLQPLSSLDMVVYNNQHNTLNHIKELTPRQKNSPTIKQSGSLAIANAMRFFMTEVLYKTLGEAEPLPDLYDEIEEMCETVDTDNANPSLPIVFLLRVAHHLGIEPLDNHSGQSPYFDLQEGRYVCTPTESTLTPTLSAMLYEYLSATQQANLPKHQLSDRRALIDALLAYYQMHISNFHNFNSHEILHSVFK